MKMIGFYGTKIACSTFCGSLFMKISTFLILLVKGGDGEKKGAPVAYKRVLISVISLSAIKAILKSLLQNVAISE